MIKNQNKIFTIIIIIIIIIKNFIAFIILITFTFKVSNGGGIFIGHGKF